MEPTNQKHLYHLLMDAMVKLEKGEMTVPAAREMSNLGARVNTAVKIEWPVQAASDCAAWLRDWLR